MVSFSKRGTLTAQEANEKALLQYICYVEACIVSWTGMVLALGWQVRIGSSVM